MDTRQLDSVGHESAALTFSAIVLDDLTHEAANRAVELALDHGINHFDVAPHYGDAELKLNEYRDEIFLGCKTLERDADGALDAFCEVKDEAVVDHIGLTSHSDPGSSSMLSTGSTTSRR